GHMSGVLQISFPAGIAAIRNNSSLRVYEAALDGGVREAQYEGRWAGGKPDNVIATGKIGTPIAATSVGFQYIRVYYVGADNKAREACWDGKGWYTGAFVKDVAPYSSIGAVFLGKNIVVRVYTQNHDNTIQEWVWDSPSTGWTAGANFGAALPGTAIAATSWGAGPYHIRVYFQDTNRNVIESGWDGSGWYTGGLKISNQSPRASLGATSWGESGSSLGIRLYYATQDNLIKEKAWDGGGGWYDGGFQQRSIPGSRVAAIPLPVLRVYLQNGTEVSGITEYAWNSGWVVGQAVLPPA
uniref:Uncharacterized protein n=1 Tax=Pseudallescheria apiosperma TaxID=563466 RepID=UPI0018E1D9CC|nr:Chain AAA, Uncharacterized protein [Scedosporium apiospermum]6TRV_BBB Chain BBB, Uncharacterized protein [Scedosporium apiospermum]